MKFILKTIKLFLSIIIINNTAEIQFVGGKISKHHGGNPAKFKHFVYNRKLDILTSNSIFSLFKWNSEIEYIKRNGNNFVKKLFSGCLPPLFIFLLSISQCVASPLNKQRIEINGPFFQGWLLRTIDHEKNASFIFIVGSFSFSGKSNYDQHYVFCAYNSIDFKIEEEIFPNKDDVSIIGSQPTHAFSSNKPLNITWTAKDHGKFVFTENSCEANFKFNSNFKIKFSAINRIPWSSKQSKNLKTSKLVNVDGPEGWLGYTTLLPCHYFIHSIGSRCQYEIEATVQQKLKKIEKISGNGYSHIEGNHGTFFPSGWIWSQSINNDNTASFSLTGGKFLIGSHSSMNFIFFLRKRNGEKVVFRSTDFDIFKYKIDPFNGSVKITAKSFFNGNNRIEMSIESQKPVHKCFGTAIYIPTAKGFLNKPGCKETYTAVATVKYFNQQQKNKKYDKYNIFKNNKGFQIFDFFKFLNHNNNNKNNNNNKSYNENATKNNSVNKDVEYKNKFEEYKFELTALEFGGTFLNEVHVKD